MESKTCIVGLVDGGDVYLGADGCVSYGGICDYGEKKVWSKGEMLFGGTGRVRPLQVAQYAFTPPPMQEDEDVLHYLSTRFVSSLMKSMKDNRCLGKDNGVSSFDGSFVVGFRGQLFNIFDRGDVTISHKPYVAQGSGTAFSLGSLVSTEDLDIEPVDRVLLALRAAAEYDPGVDPPMLVYKLSEGEAEVVYEE